MQTVAEQVNAASRFRTYFMDYFNIINQKIASQQLYLKIPMTRLNQARNSLKHHGILLIKQDIEQYKIYAENFFIQNTPLIFDINFSDISIIDLIEDTEVKQILKDAEVSKSNNDFKKGLEQLGIAFRVLINNHDDMSRVAGKSIFNLGMRISFQEGKIIRDRFSPE